ncbi:3-dehydroquinate synthase [Candidatus Gracilibacteria bacterium]|nr:3-dehydroquinate synthase [Candidatus Gracilibacteria bacterium]
MQLNINLKNNNNRSYKILFTSNILDEIMDFIVKTGRIKKVLFLTENTVWKFHGKDLFENFENKSDLKFYKYVFKAGEKNKNINTVLDTVNYLNMINFNRNDLIICFGGGVVGDLGGFLSSIYKRGVKFIQIPTTLLSVLDSSVGGKTGIDYSGIKNVIGTFNQPKIVLVNRQYLKTLPEIQLTSGYFEGLKHSLLDNKKHFEIWSSIFDEIITNKKVSDEILANNISIKANVVMRDEEEKGDRKKLNYGHTFGHAVESLSDYKLPHGICVGYGIIFANLLSYKLGYFDKTLLDYINSFVLEIVRKYKISNFKFSNIYKKMLNDKKNDSSKINFVLFKDIGNLEFIDINKKDLEETYKLFSDFLKN